MTVAAAGAATGDSERVFAHGVASGDPLPRAVVLWTRVTPTPAATPGSGAGPTVPVVWEVATDARFHNVVRRGRARTGPERDHTVKVDADRLRLALGVVADAPTWSGGLLVAAVVLVNVLFGGMRSITFVQAFQYWLKLTALLVPVFFLLAVWWGDGATGPAGVDAAGTTGEAWREVVAPGGATGLYTTYSIIVATFLGTMGLPHVVVRFYTNPDGRAARRTTLVVLALLRER